MCRHRGGTEAEGDAVPACGAGRTDGADSVGVEELERGQAGDAVRTGEPARDRQRGGKGSQGGVQVQHERRRNAHGMR